jgi:hypothetical protein
VSETSPFAVVVGFIAAIVHGVLVGLWGVAVDNPEVEELTVDFECFGHLVDQIDWLPPDSILLCSSIENGACLDGK